ncbi:MAG: hypothetical protein Alpg2KO_27640 [Alphaproteobacteria bacterium]
MPLQDHPMWRRPRHHLEQDHSHDHVHWIELFYDLIHVVIIFLLGNYLSHHMSVEGFAVFAGLFIAIWFAWADSAAFNSYFVSTDVWHRVIMASQIVTAMFMAAAIPAIHGDGLMWFMLAYALNRAITAGMYLRVIREDAHKDTRDLAWTLGRNFGLIAIVFVIAAFSPSPWSVWIFGAGVLCLQIQWMLPRIGIAHKPHASPRLGHINERFALLVLIVLGEGFFKLVLTLSEQGMYKVSPDILVNFAFGGFAIFVLAWLYWDMVGNGKIKDTKPKTMILNWLGHLMLMLAGVMIGVALAGEVKVGFWEPYGTGYAALGCAGLATYLLCLGILQNLTEHRLAHDHTRWDVKIFGIVLAIATFFIVPHVPSLVGNLLWGSALFSQIVIPVTRGWLHYR